MSKENFAKVAVAMGYATAQTAAEYVAANPRELYTSEDLAALCVYDTQRAEEVEESYADNGAAEFISNFSAKVAEYCY